MQTCFPIKEATQDNLKIAALALGSIPVVFGLIALMDWAGLNGMKWFNVMWWTGGIFVVVAVWYGGGLRRGGPLCVFLAALALHTSILIMYLRSGHPIPSVFFLFFSPFEATAIGMVLMLVGGPPERRTRGATHSSDREEPR